MLSCKAFWISEEEGSLSQPVSKTDKNRTETVEILFISGGAVFTARLKPELLP